MGHNQPLPTLNKQRKVTITQEHYGNTLAYFRQHFEELRSKQGGNMQMQSKEQEKIHPRGNILVGLDATHPLLLVDKDLLNELVSSVEELLIKDEEATALVLSYLEEIQKEADGINKQLAHKLPHFRKEDINSIKVHINKLQGYVAEVERCSTPGNKGRALAVIKSLEDHYQKLLKYYDPTSPLLNYDDSDRIKGEQILAEDQQVLEKNLNFLAFLKELKFHNTNQGQSIYIAYAWRDE